MKKISSFLVFVLCTTVLFAQDNNSKNFKKKKIKVFILSGQSNMRGWGDSTQLPDEIRFGSENKLMFEHGTWQKLKPFENPNLGMKKKGNLTEFHFGPEISFAEAISKAYPNETIGIIKSAHGGTGISAWSPNWTFEKANRTGDGKKGDLFKALINKIEAAKKEADIEIVGFLWQQGGSDMTNLDVSKEYLDNLNSLITGLRKDLNLPNLPAFIACSVSKETLTRMKNSPELKRIKKTRPGVGHVIRARFEAEEKISNVKVVVTPRLEKHPKNVHYNTNGQLKLGEHYANYFLEFVNKK